MKEKHQVLWLYTPSNMTKEVLEGMFVARESLARQLVDAVENFANGNAPKHQLIMAPRGMGKTHLISIVFSRTEHLRPDKLKVAWLNEDVSGVYDLLSFYLQVAQNAMSKEDYDAFHGELASSNHKGRATQASIAEELLAKAFSSSRLLAIIENGQQSFETIGKNDLWKLREFIVRSPWLMILASATKQFKGIQKSSDALFGFFQMISLDGLTSDEAVEMMQRVAELTHENAIVEYLKTSKGISRVRTVFQLSGGNPRIWAVFADLLKLENLEEVLPWLEQAIDSLTPYYQERFWGAYSHQQRAVLGELLTSEYWLQPKNIAEKLLLPPNQVSAILNSMVDESILERKKLGRNSYYTLREPLMRIAYEVKEAKGRPIQLVVKMLTEFHGVEELAKLKGNQNVSDYIYACVNRSQEFENVVSFIKLFGENEFDDENVIIGIALTFGVGHNISLYDNYVEHWEKIFAYFEYKYSVYIYALFVMTAIESLLRNRDYMLTSMFLSNTEDIEGLEKRIDYVNRSKSQFASLERLLVALDQFILKSDDKIVALVVRSMILKFIEVQNQPYEERLITIPNAYKPIFDRINKSQNIEQYLEDLKTKLVELKQTAKGT